MHVESHAPGDPCWIELFTPDPDTARRFYAEVFGWEPGEPSPDFGGYSMFFHDGRPVAGCMGNDDGAMGPAAWSIYLASDDLAATLGRATEHGGQVVAGPMQVGDVGHMGFVLDPSGAGIGVWQPLSHPGFVALSEDGAPAWFEVLTTDYPAEVGFYRDVFGWDTHTLSDTDELRYTTLGEGDQARAGIQDLTRSQDDGPSRWQWFVQVADTDQTVRRALAAGGTQADPTEDTPYGRIGSLLDPAGVPFLVMGP